VPTHTKQFFGITHPNGAYEKVSSDSAYVAMPGRSVLEEGLECAGSTPSSKNKKLRAIVSLPRPSPHPPCFRHLSLSSPTFPADSHEIVCGEVPVPQCRVVAVLPSGLWTLR